MKFRFLFILLSPIFLAAQNKQLVLTGNVKGLKNGANVYLLDINKITDTLAKAKVINNTFIIKKQLPEPMLVLVQYAPSASSVVFLDNSIAKLTGDIKSPDKAKVTGSSVQNDFVAYQTRFKPLLTHMMDLNAIHQQEGITVKSQAKMELIKDSIQQLVDKFIGARTASPVSAFVIASTYNLNPDVLRAEQRLNMLKKSATNNIYGTYLTQIIADEKATAIGALAGEFTQTDTSGIPVSLSSFRGKYVLIDFWASWCGPCRQENPNVVATFNKFKNKNFTVLGVSLDRENQKDRWLDAIHKDGLQWTHVSDLQWWSNAVAQQYKVESIPQNFLIGPDGRIVAKNLRGLALEDKLCEVLGCN